MPSSTSLLGFVVVKALGAGYLIYRGVRTLLARRPAAAEDASPPRSSHRLFTDGVLVSVLNPKIAVFFLAFLPQLVAPERGPVPRYASGALYLGLGVSTALTGRRH